MPFGYQTLPREVVKRDVRRIALKSGRWHRTLRAGIRGEL
jgi:hypothetical protein